MSDCSGCSICQSDYKIPPSARNFGDYVSIEQKRHGTSNEMFGYKVIGTLRSNTYVDIPVQIPAKETVHNNIVDVVACVCCGVSEREVLRYKTSDVKNNQD